jgi:hypothetical protein
VAVPFATQLAGLIPPVAVRLRRDFTLLLSLIKAHALLHRKTRPADDENRVVATLTDYAVVRDLIVDLFAEGIEATVPKTVSETVEAVKMLGGADVSLTALAAKLQLDKNPTHHRVRKAIERGFLVNNEPAKGRPLKLCIGDPITATTEILPEINKLGDCCSVVVDPRGDSRGASKASENGGAGEVASSCSYVPPKPPQQYNSHSGTAAAPVCEQCQDPSRISRHWLPRVALACRVRVGVAQPDFNQRIVGSLRRGSHGAALGHGGAAI